MGNKIRIGTRESRLALCQTEKVVEALADLNVAVQTEIIPMRTSGDWDPRSDKETRLNEAEGGKGMFVKEIEQALLEGQIDMAVHSMKDVPSFLPEGLVIEHMLEREDARDAFISLKAKSIYELAEGAVVGTASVRRQAFALSKRPDLKIAPFRGNVPKRIEKLRAGAVDATFLAVAGLKRLKMEDAITCILEPEEMLPSAGQGAIGIEICEGRQDLRELLSLISAPRTVACVQAERAALQELDGSCHTPVGAYAELDGGELYLRVAVASLDGRHFFSDEGRRQLAGPEDSKALGREIATRIKSKLPRGIIG